MNAQLSVQAADQKAALQVFDKMLSRGLTPHSFLNNHINAQLSVQAADQKAALQVFDKMLSRGLTPHSFLNNHINAQLSVQAADQKAALQVFDEMLSRGVKPTAQCYTSLLAACSRGGDLAAARRVFRTMQVGVVYLTMTDILQVSHNLMGLSCRWSLMWQPTLHLWTPASRRAPLLPWMKPLR